MIPLDFIIILVFLMICATFGSLMLPDSAFRSPSTRRRDLAASRNQKRQSLELVDALGAALGHLDTEGLIGVPGAGPKDPVAETWNEYFAAKEADCGEHFMAVRLHTQAAVGALARFAASHIDGEARDQILAASTAGVLAKFKTSAIAPVKAPPAGPGQIELPVSVQPPVRRGADSLVGMRDFSRKGDSLTHGNMTVRGDLVYRGIVNGNIEVLSGHLDFEGKIGGNLNVQPGASATLRPGTVIWGSVVGAVDTGTARIRGSIS